MIASRCASSIYLAVATVVSTPLGSTDQHRFEYTQVHMGMPVRIVLYAAGEDQAGVAARAAFSRIAALDRMMSDYRSDSDLTAVSIHAGEWVEVGTELVAVLARAIEIARASEGAFDPSVGPVVTLWRDARRTYRMPDPSALAAARARVGWQRIALDSSRHAVRIDPGMRLDLGGIAKGWIIQDAVRTLRLSNVTRALIEAGGDIVVGEAPPGRTGWHIDTPGADAAFSARASRLTNAALSTSGPTAQFVELDGVRYSHVVDPRTGLGLTNDLVAFVIAGDGATADALATALTVIGPHRSRALLGQFPSASASLHRER